MEEFALKGYERALRQGILHVHSTNACYDACAHCYISAISPKSSCAKFIDADNLIHFTKLLSQNRLKKDKLFVTLSGGDFLLHPKAVTILDTLSKYSLVDVMSSGFPLSKRNTTNRKELLEALVRNNITCVVASPDEYYHSLTWDDVDSVAEYIKKQGYNPKRLGYSSKKQRKRKKLLSTIILASTIVGGVTLLSDHFSSKKNLPPKSMPLGRAKNLDSSYLNAGRRDCTPFRNLEGIAINYAGDLQYCFHATDDGFMNIRELAGINDKEDAIKLILARLSEDISAKDMITYGRCYFSKKIRKK